MRKSIVMAIIALLAFTSVAFAFVIGESNLGIMGYPSHSCYQPSKPYGNDQWAWEHFKREVGDYEDCIRLYVEGAGNDQKRIAEKANEAIQEFNDFVSRLNY